MGRVPFEMEDIYDETSAEGENVCDVDGCCSIGREITVCCNATLCDVHFCLFMEPVCLNHLCENSSVYVCTQCADLKRGCELCSFTKGPPLVFLNFQSLTPTHYISAPSASFTFGGF